MIASPNVSIHSQCNPMYKCLEVSHIVFNEVCSQERVYKITASVVEFDVILADFYEVGIVLLCFVLLFL